MLVDTHVCYTFAKILIREEHYEFTKSDGPENEWFAVETQHDTICVKCKAGLTKQAISNIMNEKYSSIKFEIVIKIADAFDMTVQEFLGDENFK